MTRVFTTLKQNFNKMCGFTTTVIRFFASHLQCIKQEAYAFFLFDSR